MVFLGDHAGNVPVNESGGRRTLHLEQSFIASNETIWCGGEVLDGLMIYYLAPEHGPVSEPLIRLDRFLLRVNAPLHSRIDIVPRGQARKAFREDILHVVRALLGWIPVLEEVHRIVHARGRELAAPGCEEGRTLGI